MEILEYIVFVIIGIYFILGIIYESIKIKNERKEYEELMNFIKYDEDKKGKE